MNNSKDELEWDAIDTACDMALQDPFIKPQINNCITRILEERKKVKDSDNQLTNELFDNQEKEESIKDKSIVFINKMKLSGIKLVDNGIKKQKVLKITIKNNSKKIYDEYILNNQEEESIDIEDKYFFNQRKL